MNPLYASHVFRFYGDASHFELKTGPFPCFRKFSASATRRFHRGVARQWPGQAFRGWIPRFCPSSCNPLVFMRAVAGRASFITCPSFFYYNHSLFCLTFLLPDQDAAPVGVDRNRCAALRAGSRSGVHRIEMLHSARSQVGEERPDVLDYPHHQASGEYCCRHSHDDHHPSRRYLSLSLDAGPIEMLMNGLKLQRS